MTAAPRTDGAVIVGASIAGVSTARALRRRGYAGPITLVNERSAPECDRPPLSKQFLSGAWDRQRVTLLAEAEAAELDLRVLHGVTGAGIDAEARVVSLADGRLLPYDTAVIATGASARPVPWSALDGVHSLRTADDADRLRAQLVRGAAVVVIGGGYIGCEVAATATQLGCAVTVVDPLAAPLERVLGQELGAHLAGAHERNGVRALLGRGVADVTRDTGGLSVTLTDGAVLAADTVVVGIGAVPNTAWLAGSDIESVDGVVCDERLRVGGRPELHAAGDVARWTHPRHGSLRVEHWTNAVEQAAAVADDIVDPDASAPADLTPYVWSDQYGVRLQIAGLPARATRRCVVGALGDGAPGAVVYGTDGTDGTVCGVATLGWARAALVGRRAVATRASFDDTLDALRTMLR